MRNVNIPVALLSYFSLNLPADICGNQGQSLGSEWLGKLLVSLLGNLSVCTVSLSSDDDHTPCNVS